MGTGSFCCDYCWDCFEIIKLMSSECGKAEVSKVFYKEQKLRGCFWKHLNSSNYYSQ